ncbi:MAG: LacI family transcriptional regulator, partial [Epulopiscium sp.]|nr:LacI family transcriptional regulator [Candidatus Epulonipiscium sp.]
MEKPTIADVAKYAGVSITTVSRVINNNYPVKEETRQKVEEAIKELNFKPNYLARSLIGKSTHTIGVIVPSITNLFFPVVVKGIEKVCSQKAFSLFLCDTDGKEESERIQMQNLLEKQVDGVLVIDPRYENIENGFYEECAKKIPLVLINGYHRGIRCNFVLNDQEMGALQALEYLIKLGHRDIAFLRAKNSYSYDIKEQIYYETLQKHQIP